MRYRNTILLACAALSVLTGAVSTSTVVATQTRTSNVIAPVATGGSAGVNTADNMIGTSAGSNSGNNNAAAVAAAAVGGPDANVGVGSSAGTGTSIGTGSSTDNEIPAGGKPQDDIQGGKTWNDWKQWAAGHGSHDDASGWAGLPSGARYGSQRPGSENTVTESATGSFAAMRRRYQPRSWSGWFGSANSAQSNAHSNNAAPVVDHHMQARDDVPRSGPSWNYVLTSHVSEQFAKRNLPAGSHPHSNGFDKKPKGMGHA